MLSESHFNIIFFWLEQLLEHRRGPASERELLYTGLLQLYSRHRMIDMAINLSRRHREEQLKTPEFYELLGELIESQYSSTTTPITTQIMEQQHVTMSGPPGLMLPLSQPLEQQQQQQPFLQAFQYNPYFNQFVPVAAPQAATAPLAAVPSLPCGLFCPAEQPPLPPSQYQYYYPMMQQQQLAALYPTPPQSEISASPPLCGYPPAPETPDLMSISSDAPSTLMSLCGGGGPPMLGLGADSLVEFFLPPSQQQLELHHHQHTEPGYLHRQLKRAVSNGDAEEGLAMYLALERAGKVVNVTESSSLIEQLVRADMTHEATQLTQAMLQRNTHPLPKIFRYGILRVLGFGSGFAWKRIHFPS